eukprot:765047-Hanusia_phi.AAC.8
MALRSKVAPSSYRFLAHVEASDQNSAEDGTLGPRGRGEGSGSPVERRLTDVQLDHLRGQSEDFKEVGNKVDKEIDRQADRCHIS